jgi:manganese efflux pump family protein
LLAAEDHMAVIALLVWLGTAGGGLYLLAGGRTGAGPEPVPPERHFPVAVVIGHGVFAAVTIVLVLLTALGVGES